MAHLGVYNSSNTRSIDFFFSLQNGKKNIIWFNKTVKAKQHSNGKWGNQMYGFETG